MKNYKTILVTIAILISACHSEKNKTDQGNYSVGISDYSIANAPEAPPPPPQLQEQLKYTPPKVVGEEEVIDEEKPIINQEKKIVKNGSLSIKSHQIDSSKRYLDEQLKKYLAYYESEELSNESEAISYNLKIRIPSKNFEQFIKGVESGKDEIISKSIQAEDVIYINSKINLMLI